MAGHAEKARACRASSPQGGDRTTQGEEEEEAVAEQEEEATEEEAGRRRRRRRRRRRPIRGAACDLCCANARQRGAAGGAEHAQDSCGCHRGCERARKVTGACFVWGRAKGGSRKRRLPGEGKGVRVLLTVRTAYWSVAPTRTRGRVGRTCVRSSVMRGMCVHVEECT